jgi:hypothetical protein
MIFLLPTPLSHLTGLTVESEPQAHTKKLGYSSVASMEPRNSLVIVDHPISRGYGHSYGLNADGAINRLLDNAGIKVKIH